MYRKVLPLLLVAIPSTATADHLSGGFGLQSSAPFWTESAQTLNSGQIAAGVRAEYQQLRPYDDAKLSTLRREDGAANPDLYQEGAGDHNRQANLHSVNDLLGGSFRLAYGITDDLTVGLRLPFLYRDGIREVSDGHIEDGEHHGTNNIADHGSSEGIGDMSFWGQYQFYKDSKQSAALMLGMKAPTGETTNEGYKRFYNHTTGADVALPDDVTSRRLETHLQPGSGSWDGMFGLAYGYDLGVVQLNTSAMYTLATKGSQDTDLGDGFNYNFAASLPVKYMTPCAACSWNLVLEANGEWRDQEKRGNNITIGNSGGNTLYISPGVRFISGQNWNVGTSVGYAVIHDLHGNQSDPDYRVMGAFNMAI